MLKLSFLSKLAAIAAGLMMTIGLVVTSASPAAAYTNSNLTIKYAIVDTGNCKVISGSLKAHSSGDYCVSNDSVDGTYFRKDAGGRAVKAMVYNSGSLVAKFEFHPYGEKLWIYDTKNDSDTMYAGLDVTTNNSPYAWPVQGSSKKIDIATWDFDLPEGKSYKLSICDGKHSYLGTCTDVIRTIGVKA